EGGAAGDRLPVDGEWSVLRRERRHLWHADGGRAGDRARCAGRHPDPRRVPVPHPRAVRLARHPPPGEAEGMTLDPLLFVLGVPLTGALLLGLVGHRPFARDINSAASFGTFIAACALTARVVAEGPIFAWDREFFVDPLNVFLVTLTAFVAFTTS